jgi:hypothetical protein
MLKHKFLILAVLGACALSLFMTVFHSERWVYQFLLRDPKASIGKVQTLVGDVRKRPARDLIWLPLIKGDVIQSRDTIYVGGDSNVAIQLNEGTSIEVGENSLFTVRRAGQRNSLHLDQGVAKLSSIGATRVDVSTRENPNTETKNVNQKQIVVRSSSSSSATPAPTTEESADQNEEQGSKKKGKTVVQNAPAGATPPPSQDGKPAAAVDIRQSQIADSKKEEGGSSSSVILIIFAVYAAILITAALLQLRRSNGGD